MANEHWIDAKKGVPKRAFGPAAAGQPVSTPAPAAHAGSDMIRKDKPYPELRPGGALASRVKTETHFAAMQQESNAAQGNQKTTPVAAPSSTPAGQHWMDAKKGVAKRAFAPAVGHIAPTGSGAFKQARPQHERKAGGALALRAQAHAQAMQHESAATQAGQQSAAQKQLRDQFNARARHMDKER